MRHAINALEVFSSKYCTCEAVADEFLHKK